MSTLVGLPSLDLLRSFVAVGRRMSITLAADELCLTQSAVSRQIAALEGQLGVPLLVRRHRAIGLTDDGERLYRVAEPAVRELQEAVGELRANGAARPVTLTASVGVMGLWMLPRLGRLQRDHPGLELRLSASNRRSDLRAEQIDLAIRYCVAQAAPAGSVPLFGETIAAVAHPRLAQALGKGGLSTAQAMSELHLLELDDNINPRLRWAGWLAARGWQQARPRAMVRFNQYDQVIHAALAGQGVALGRLELIAGLIAEGQLTVLDAPAAMEEPGEALGYWLIQADARPRQAVRKVAEWILREAEAVRAAAALSPGPSPASGRGEQAGSR
ncbi:LysR substrate-binding domain-containing protein [Cupriavidus sp. AU9028]|uniref:LysR substrate-binding domain-containing protein n=1 Tax=Cupriavidus sp. AU9028 TaxID=2871157 RepID=UPI001C94B872|nr:LysR substrate-binding domain-containing protein [Cupriavidus sp. AU9028]MBY4899310.1 LysR family transcriptional regulator [Cupriavidus sp. AU9028]